MSSLERTLAALSDRVDWPEPSPHLVTRVAARIEPGEPSKPVSRRWVWALAAGILIAVVGLVPSTRQAIAGLFQEAGVRIGFVEETPSALGRDLRLGEAVTVGEAASRVDFELKHPEALGPPEELYVDGFGIVSMLWDGPVLLMQRSVQAPLYAEKRVGPDTSVVEIELKGEPALWVEGAEHSFSYLDADANIIRETTRLAANVLLWSADGVDYRLELSEGLDEALEIAGSMRATR
jgi:hypothetical protein